MKYFPNISEITINRWRSNAGFWVNTLGWNIFVPMGITSDLASVPRWFWWIIAPNELGIAAPFLHDMLYDGKEVLTTLGYRSFTKEQADSFLFDVAKQDDTIWWKRVAAYYVVKYFGKSHWRGNNGR